MNDIKFKIQKGSNQIIFFRQHNGMDLEMFHYDYATYKREIQKMEAENLGVNIFQKNNKEMHEFIESVSLQQSNYQLGIAKALLENAELTKTDLLVYVKQFNNKHIGTSAINDAANVLIRKGIVKLNYQDGLYALNSDLSKQKKEELINLATTRLGFCSVVRTIS